MNNKIYTILDNFGQELNDFDIVVTSACKQGCQVSELGVYWCTGVFTLNDFDNKIANNETVVMKKNTLWNTGRSTNIVNRVEVEAGMIRGTFKMKNVIKLDNPNEEVMDFRVKIITLLEAGRVASNVSRKLLIDLIEDAKYMGYM